MKRGLGLGVFGVVIIISIILVFGPSLGTRIGAGLGPTSMHRPVTARVIGLHPEADAVTVSDTGYDPSVVSLAWSRSTDVYNYNYTIDYALSSNGPWTEYNVISVTDTTSEAILGLTPDTTYYFQVWDCGLLVGCTASANTLEVATAATATLTDSVTSESSVSLAWTNGASYGGWIGFGSYVVEESVNGGAYSTLTTITSGSTTTDAVNALSVATNYAFKVETTDNQSKATYSNPVSLTTPSTLATVASASPATITAGQSTNLTCTATGGVGPYSYTWAFGDSTTGTGATSTHTYTSTGTFTATCTARDAYGLTASSTASVTVNPVPASPTVAGLPTSQGYDLVAAIIVVVVVAIVVTALIVRSRKKGREPPRPYASTAPPSQGSEAPPPTP